MEIEVESSGSVTAFFVPPFASFFLGDTVSNTVVQCYHGFTCLIVLFPWVCLGDFGLVAMKSFFPPFILFKSL